MTTMETLGESIEKIKKMGRDVGEFKRNVGKVVIFLDTFEYNDVTDIPSYEASAVHYMVLQLVDRWRTGNA